MMMILAIWPFFYQSCKIPTLAKYMSFGGLCMIIFSTYKIGPCLLPPDAALAIEQQQRVRGAPPSTCHSAGRDVAGPVQEAGSSSSPSAIPGRPVS